MGLDVLLETIGRDAAADARRVVEAARAEAGQIRAAADAAAERQCSDTLAVKEAELQVGFDARRAQARREARSAVLAARAGFLDRTFAAAEAAIPGHFDQARAQDAFRRLVEEALECFGDTPVLVRCRPGLAQRIDFPSKASNAIHVVADDSVPEGVIVEAADGSSRVDNTLIARLQRSRPALSIALAAALPEAT